MVTGLLFVLLLSGAALAATLDRARHDPFPAQFDDPPAPEAANDAANELPVFYAAQRPRRSPGSSYNGVSSYSGGYNSGSGGGVYSSGGFNGFAPAGFWGGYAGNFGPSIPQFPAPNFAPFPYQAQMPFDLSALFNQYFNALQNYHQSLQSQYVPFNPSSDAAAVTTRQITLGPLSPGTLPSLPLNPGSGQLAQLANNARQSLQRALCQALQRLQVNWAQTASVCSSVQQGSNSIAAASGTGIVAVSGPDGAGGSQVSVISPPGAVVEHFQGPGGLQGVSVSHESFNPAGAGGGGGYGGTFSSVSSSSSSVNGEHQSHHSATTGVNNNGHVTSITVTKP